MPLVRCPHCGEDTFTIAGWADLDRCASCGKALARARVVELQRAAIELGWRRRRSSPAAPQRRRPRAGA